MIIHNSKFLIHNCFYDIPHSHASILKAKTILGYEPEFDAKRGFDLAAKWYFNNI